MGASFPLLNHKAIFHRLVFFYLPHLIHGLQGIDQFQESNFIQILKLLREDIFYSNFSRRLTNALIFQLFTKDFDFIDNFKESISKLIHTFTLFHFESFKLSFQIQYLYLPSLFGFFDILTEAYPRLPLLFHKL